MRGNATTTLPYDKTTVSLPNLPRPAVKISPVTTQVVEAKYVAHGREQRALCPTKKKKAAKSALVSPDPNPLDYGSITQLRELLGLAPLCSPQAAHTAKTLPRDALIVSIDVEWERRGRRERIVEIGITILDTRDTIDVLPGQYCSDWFARAKTYHYVVNVTRRPWQRMRGCLFSDDRFGDVSTIRKHIRKILQRAAYPCPNLSGPIGHGPRKVVLVGHSVVRDLQSLYRSPGLELDFLGTDVFLTKPTTVFDTFMLTVAANKQGAKIRWRELGRLVNRLGVHPRYQHFESVIGRHNAGNDAAYAMMALLMYAIHWEEIVPRDTEPLPAEETERRPDSRSESHGCTLEELRSASEDSKLEKTTPAIPEKTCWAHGTPLSTPEASAEAEQQYLSPSHTHRRRLARVSKLKTPC